MRTDVNEINDQIIKSNQHLQGKKNIADDLIKQFQENKASGQSLEESKKALENMTQTNVTEAKKL